MKFNVRPGLNYATEIDLFCIEHGINVPRSYRGKFIGQIKLIDLGDYFEVGFINNTVKLIEFEKMLQGFI
jgi:hypothetical protein